MSAAYACAMTITDHLEFSVLTAPLAAMDRRSLSQAWYSALYAQERSPEAPAARMRPSAQSETAAPARSKNAIANNSRIPSSARTHTVEDERGRLAAAGPERRAARSPLARRIERTFTQWGNVARNGTFRLDGAKGRVHVVLQQRGSHVQLIAVCDARAHASVAAALAQARYALAARGIVLETRAQAASC